MHDHDLFSSPLLNSSTPFHTRRQDAAPEITEDDFISWLQVQSKNNTPIEGFWLWLRAGEGHNVRDVILGGTARFNSNDPLHMYAPPLSYRSPAALTDMVTSSVFNWLWPPLVQERLDDFREYWNNHTVRRQKEKDLPSGTSPIHIWSCPTHMRPTARDCRVHVHRDMIRHLHDQIGGEEAHQEAYQFVTPEFQAEADGAYADLGYPRITLKTAWTVFHAIVAVVQAQRE